MIKNIISLTRIYETMSTKDKFGVFDVNLQRLNSLIDENQLSNCFVICADLTRYSAMSGYTDGLLISEVLEGVFSQITNMIKIYEISDEEKHHLASELKNGISKIKNTYRDDDKNSLYNDSKK